MPYTVMADFPNGRFGQTVDEAVDALTIMWKLEEDHATNITAHDGRRNYTTEELKHAVAASRAGDD